ncbi:MAG: DUF4384 domain-containing protein [Myxococcaceae bacterium]|nr:DUF4384 domain-containing protein [Myxococcaceae bacterium]
MTAPRPIPEALLERYLANDLGPDERRSVDERLAASAPDRARLDAMRADSAAFLIKHPPGPVAAKLAEPSRARGFIGWLAPLALAAAAFIAVVMLKPPPEPDIGLKGDVALAVFRQTEGGAERVESGATLKAGDKLRFEVRAKEAGYVAIVSRDGAGAVTVYYPFQGTTSAAYRPEEALLPGAIALDETPGEEVVWAVYATKAFELDSVMKAVAAGGAPAAPFARVSWTKK